jgi:hypothetical protein
MENSTKTAAVMRAVGAVGREGRAATKLLLLLLLLLLRAWIIESGWTKNRVEKPKIGLKVFRFNPFGMEPPSSGRVQNGAMWHQAPPVSTRF